MANDKTIEQKMIIDEMSNKISDILKYYSYEDNNIETRKFITEKCNDVLKDIPFADFNVVCDESNNTFDVIDNNMIKLDIAYRFNKGDEFTVRQYSVRPINSTFDEVLNEGK
jgi:hypothetical protein